MSTFNDGNSWATSLVGRNWEIFWEIKADTTDDTLDDAIRLVTDAPPPIPKEDNEMNTDTPTTTTATTTATSTTNNIVDFTEGQSLTTPLDTMDVEVDHKVIDSKGDNDNNNDDNNDDDEDEDEADWYEAHVASFFYNNVGVLQFRITFQGAEEIYTMGLMPSIVRPCAKSWTKRSKALLTSPSLPSFTARSTKDQKHQEGLIACGNADSGDSSWESILPRDTATLEDETSIKEIQKSVMNDTMPFSSMFPTQGDIPEEEEGTNVVMMREFIVCLRSQVYLRSRLALLVSHGDSTDEDPEPTEIMVDHLVHCLNKLHDVCVWYCEQSVFHSTILRRQSMFHSTVLRRQSVPSLNKDKQVDVGTVIDVASVGDTTILLSQYSDDLGEPLDMNYVGNECLITGLDSFFGLLSMDISLPVGKESKRIRPDTIASKRKGKRRKISRKRGAAATAGDDCSGDAVATVGLDKSEDFYNLLASSECFERAVVYLQKAATNREEKDDRPWYMKHLAKLLLEVALDIQIPLTTWKQRARALLGEWPETKNEDRVGEDGGDQQDSEENISIEDKANETTSSTKFYTSTDVTACIAFPANSGLLRQFNTSCWVDKLITKLQSINSNELYAWKLLSRILEDPSHQAKEGDDVLNGLTTLQSSLNLSNGQLSNIDPLGVSSSRLTRRVIDEAIVLRSWILDLTHAEACRERVHYVQNVVAQAASLPNVPLLPSRCLSNTAPVPVVEWSELGMSSMLGRVKILADGLKAHISTLPSYGFGDLTVSTEEMSSMSSSAKISQFLEQLKIAVPAFVSVKEEILNVRFDILLWNEKASVSMEKSSSCPTYLELKKQHDQLKELLKGRSHSRLRLIEGLEANAEIDKEVRNFAVADISQHCGPTSLIIEELHTKTSEWKERVDGVISCLRSYGNTTAGDIKTLYKNTSMVDLTRISELLKEEANFRVIMPLESTSVLHRVFKEANDWSCRVKKIVQDLADPHKCLLHLIAERKHRPAGIMMEPARHVVDLWIEVLDWHNRVKKELQYLQTLQINDPYHSGTAANTDMFKSWQKSMCLVLLEGLEIIELFSQSRPNNIFTASYILPMKTLAAKMLEQQHKKPVRIISHIKLASSTEGSRILDTMISERWDVEQGSPILCLLFLAWQSEVKLMVDQHGNILTSDSNVAAKRPTLDQAQKLNDLTPHLRVDDPQKKFHYFASFITAENDSVKNLHNLITKGEQTEASARASLLTMKTIVRGSYEKVDAVREYLSELKAIQAAFKSPSGLALSNTLEEILDQSVRDLGWLVKTFPYKSLHSNEIVGSGGKVQESIGEMSISALSRKNENVLPWDALVQLFERLPDLARLSENGSGGDIARVSFRVKELHEEANAWQEEVSRVLALSIRGAKRRIPGGNVTSPSKVQGCTKEDENERKIDFFALEKLAKCPVLMKVLMPRHSAVLEVLNKAREFNTKLSNFLDKDFDDETNDRARLPNMDSLIGKDNEFLLYRLTGSPLYAALHESIEYMTIIGDEILAETPRKTALKWIKGTVFWIDELRDAVTDESPFEGVGKKVIIPSNHARSLIETGRILVEQLTDEIRKTLAKFKVSLSTKKHNERLTVVIGKNGAQQSLGGTALRWFPLLLEALKSDLIRLNSWETTMTATARMIESKPSVNMEESRAGSKLAYEWYWLGEKLDELLLEGKDYLVVAPEKALVKHAIDLHGVLDKWPRVAPSAFVDHSNLQKYLKRCDEDSGTSVENRFSVLDSLLRRSRLTGMKLNSKAHRSSLKVLESKCVREKSVSVLYSSFCKGAQMVGYDAENIETTENGVGDCCALKAWELERAIHSNMARKANLTFYRDKVLSLRFNLENNKNPTLCPRALIGDVSMYNLVSMTPEELADEEKRRARAIAEEEANKTCVLNPGVLIQNPLDKKETEKYLKIRGKATKVTAILKAIEVRKTEVTRSPLGTTSLPKGVNQDEVDVKVRSSPPSTTSNLLKKVDRSQSPTQAQGRQLNSSNNRPKVVVGVGTLVQKALASAGPLTSVLRSSPSPPPSPNPQGPDLSPSPIPTPQAWHPISTEETRAFPNQLLTNDSGGDRFNFSFSSPDNRFMGGLYLHPCDRDLDGVLPGKMHAKGRLRLEEFSRFLADKTKGGRWFAVPLRFATFSDLDAMEYKRFYKDYEAKKRIAMFAVGKETKLFLVTPGFHTTMKHLRDALLQKNSTYAVVLTKENLRTA